MDALVETRRGMGEAPYDEPDCFIGGRRSGGKLSDPNSSRTGNLIRISKSTKRKVFDTVSGTDVGKNEKGEVALHGQTVSAWTTAIPGTPLKSGG